MAKEKKYSVKTPKYSACPVYESTVFRNCPALLAEKYFQNKKFITYNKGGFLFKEGDETLGVYCIYEGEVNVVKKDSKGNVEISRWAGEGDVLGIHALFGKKYFTSSGVSLTKVKVCFVPKEDFFRMKKRESHNLPLQDALRILFQQIEFMENKIVRHTPEK